MALLIPIAIILLSIWLASQTGAAAQALPPRGMAEFLVLIPIMLLFGPAPEEFSFRGYGQRELQATMSPLAAALHTPHDPRGSRFALQNDTTLTDPPEFPLVRHPIWVWSPILPFYPILPPCRSSGAS